MAEKKSTVQLIWGALHLQAGFGVICRIPQVMPEIKKIEHFSPYIVFIYFCFYLLAVLLIAGGGKKIYHYIKQSKPDDSND
ncbi:MAG: hypothetical protein P8185_09180 [Deltaproteobacteria bacterium]